MNKLSSKVAFMLFCLEAYKKREKISGTDALSKFKRLNFLKDGYDVLHTQSLDNIVDEIKEYIIERK